MQRLILMRHAEAEATAASGRDRDRRLSVVGRAEARAMGQVLAARGLRPDRALVSPARRTRETWELMRETLGEVEVRFEESLFNGAAETLRGEIETLDRGAGCLIVLAHNPGIHRLAVDYLVEGGATTGALDRLRPGYPTGAATILAAGASGGFAFEAFLRPADGNAV